jgi:enoyl-CoA hydratase/carnithine racemase
MSTTYQTLRIGDDGEGVVTVVIDAPPTNLIGPELVRDLVGVLTALESEARAATLFARGLQTRGDLELNLGTHIGLL